MKMTKLYLVRYRDGIEVKNSVTDKVLRCKIIQEAHVNVRLRVWVWSRQIWEYLDV